MRAGGITAICLAAFCLAGGGAPPARAQTAHLVFPLRIQLVNEQPARWAATLQWVDVQVESANEAFRGSHIQFATTGWRAIEVGEGAIRSRSQFDAMATSVDEHAAIDVFVVPGITTRSGCYDGYTVPLDDVEGLPRFITIVHAVGPVLTHELGHFFGLAHSAEALNIMYAISPSVGDTGGRGLDDSQLRAIRTHAEAFALAGTPHPITAVPRRRPRRAVSDGF